jgi:hypothetical protein
MKRRYELSIGRWSAMLGSSVHGRLLLICHDITIVFAGRSLGELIAHVIGRCWRRARRCTPVRILYKSIPAPVAGARKSRVACPRSNFDCHRWPKNRREPAPRGSSVRRWPFAPT